MKIILQKPVDKLGVPGDVVDVADGYARNYLMPRGLAVKATKGGVKHVDSLKRAHSTRVNAAKADAEQVAQRLMASPITVPAHAGEEGRLFGSVTPNDVAAAIEAQTGVRLVHRHVVPVDPNAGLRLDRLGDIARRDAAEQPALLAGVRRDPEG